VKISSFISANALRSNSHERKLSKDLWSFIQTICTTFYTYAIKSGTLVCVKYICLQTLQYKSTKQYVMVKFCPTMTRQWKQYVMDKFCPTMTRQWKQYVMYTFAQLWRGNESYTLWLSLPNYDAAIKAIRYR